MKKTVHLVALCAGITFMNTTHAAPITVGAAPKGEATAVASKIIKYNFPSCKKMGSATRGANGSIRASCDGTEYLVFTVFNPKEGRTIELALNCAAAKKHLDVAC